MILEKCWAKLHGSYQRIDGGQAAQTLRDLTGAPGFEYVIADEKDMWGMITKADKEDHIMCAGISGDNEEQDKDLGLVAGHAYGLIKAATVKDKSGQEVNIVQLRNPWGSFEWKGSWSDDSDDWTPELKK